MCWLGPPHLHQTKLIYIEILSPFLNELIGGVLLFFPTTETYPAGCNLTPPHGDGRHFSRNEHYLIKARLILNLAKSYARAARGTGGTFGVAYEQ